MPKTKKFALLAEEKTINKVIKALQKNGVHVEVAEDEAQAREKILSLLPPGSQVMNMTSITLQQLGVDKDITESGKFIAVRKLFELLDKNMQKMDMKRLGAAHDWVIGSVHALTEDASFVIASATGSQLASYAYGADNVLWVIGAQKIVKDLKEAVQRIEQYCFALENQRALKAYDMKSGINKILIIHKEVVPDRLHVIIVKKKLGF